MIKVDLITGFLGAGKTTFIKKYVNYLLQQGEKIAILENDYGAINIDMMLLQDELGDQCELEMVAGGCDYDCHRRRFKTKLISMGMRGFSRVIIEPSGIFDVDEFFDIIHEDPLTNWYEIENVLTIVDGCLSKDLSHQSHYLLASQCVCAGKIIFSKLKEDEDIEETMSTINKSIQMFKGKRVITSDDVIAVPWSTLTDKDFETIKNAGYNGASIMKQFVDRDNDYDSIFFMNQSFSKESILILIQQLLNDEECGHIIRIKGFIKENDKWLEVNSTKEEHLIQEMSIGQEVIIVIGEHLQKNRIEKYMRDIK